MQSGSGVIAENRSVVVKLKGAFKLQILVCGFYCMKGQYRRYLESLMSGAHPMIRPHRSGDWEICSALSDRPVKSAVRGEGL